ncbi:MAG: zinc-binding alcohol dehydrogenase, partial [Oscillospiraceae bacterium]|nr:zinc-binding alcohol dehydrogenase [Oscillospiraceae bacterium]
MKNSKIFFTAVRKAEFLPEPVREIEANEVLSEMEYTVISGGTERACIMAMENTSKAFPMSLGYCGVGRVVRAGNGVKSVQPGDRVLVYHGNHAKYNIRTEEEITKVDDDTISSLDAAFVIIASMGLGGVRKLEIEIGESAMVMGLGLLGIFSVQFCRLNGAYPVIAVDPNKERRDLALKLGADYVLDPTAEDFSEQIAAITGGKGINACVEVTGSSLAMKQ